MPRQIVEASAFPLDWPEGWPRTEYREPAAYRVEFTKARTHLLEQLRLMGADQTVLSTNIPLRNDGLPYADAGARRYADPGVAVYFLWKGSPHVIACDRWDHVKDNLRAVGLALEALRMIDRTGASEILKRAFTGFRALPAPGETAGSPAWWDVLGVAPTASPEAIKKRYRQLATEHHPDRGGDLGAMAVVNRAYEQAVAARGEP